MKLTRVSGRACSSCRTRLAERVSGLNLVTSVSVWLNSRLNVVRRSSEVGTQLATTSMPSVLVSKSLTKKRKFSMLAAAVMPSATSLFGFLRREDELLGQHQSIGHVDAERVDGERERAPVEHQADRVVLGLLRLERLAAAQQRHLGGRRDGAVVDQLHLHQVELGRHVEGVRLARRRRPEAGLDRATQGQIVGELEAARHLAVGGRAEVLEVLEAHRDAHREAVVPGRCARRRRRRRSCCGRRFRPRCRRSRGTRSTPR